jgi:cell division protease FtsH
MSDLEEARDKVMWGSERKSRAMDDKEKRLTAYHEAGHALVQQLVDESEPLHKVTIIPRGIAYLGATMSLPEKDTYTISRKKLISDLAIAMGGRTAEQIIFGDVTNGASQDIRHATEIARLMVCNWGMSDELGPQEFGQNQELMFLGREVSRQQNFSDSTAKRIDAEISRLLREASESAQKLISQNRDKLEIIAERLLEIETIEGRDIAEIVEHGRVLSRDERDEIDRKKEQEEEKKNPSPTPPPIPDSAVSDNDEDESQSGDDVPLKIATDPSETED